MRELAQGAARRARASRESLLEGTDGGTPRVIAIGEVLDVPSGAAPARRRRCRSTWRAPSRNCSSTVELDFVHVHEPFAPSASSAALRHSRALNVGSFHAPTERLLSTLLARRFVESFFGRLDARTASLPATAELMARHFPGDYRARARRRRRRRRARADLPRAGRAPPRPRAATRRCASAWPARPLIDVDLHMHTDHSHDCATPVEVLLATAREQGLGAIAVTDHNEISGALEARAKADGRPA